MNNIQSRVNKKNFIFNVQIFLRVQNSSYGMTHQSDITDKKKRSVANIRENIFTSFCLKNIVEHHCYVVTKV